MKEKIKTLLSNWAIRFYSVLVMVTFLALYAHDRNVGFDNVDWEGIWIEAHGMFFDILILGFLLAVYDHFRERTDKIERYKEEIDDYRFWNEKEAAYRIKGNVMRLKKLKAKGISLYGCYLAHVIIHKIDLQYINMVKANFENSTLYGCDFKYCTMRDVDFKIAKIVLCDFADLKIRESNFSGSQISYSRLKNTKFYGCDLSGCDLQYSDLRFAKFIDCDLSNATAIEYQKDFFIKAGADISQMHFKPNPDDFDKNKDIYLAGRSFEIRRSLIESIYPEILE